MEGELWGQIRPDDSEWDVGYSKRFNNTVLHIMLPKATQQHWVYCLKRWGFGKFCVVVRGEEG
eukprot:1339284-Amorphochlora_amoeboformis.AAC.2